MIGTVLPRLVVRGADEAIDFYRRAFDAELTERFTAPDGSVVHAELRIGESLVTLKDEDEVDRSATSYGGSPVLLMLAVSDADAVAAAMEQAGARVIFPVGDQSYGYRQAAWRTHSATSGCCRRTSASSPPSRPRTASTPISPDLAWPARPSREAGCPHARAVVHRLGGGGPAYRWIAGNLARVCSTRTSLLSRTVRDRSSPWEVGISCVATNSW